MAIEIDRNFWTFTLVVVGSVLAIGSAYIQYKDKKDAEQESILAKKETKEANEELKNRTDELLKANRKINELTNETLKVALGSGYLEVNLNWHKSSDYEFIITNNSDYPIYDISIELIDFDILINCPQKRANGIVTISEKCLSPAVIRGNRINVIPNTNITFGPKLQFSNNFKHFLVKVHSRNSTTIRLCVFEKKENNIVKMSSRFYLSKKSGLEMIEEKNEIGLTKDYWEEHFFKEIVFSVAYN